MNYELFDLITNLIDIKDLIGLTAIILLKAKAQNTPF
jgi:hypothetical protein